MKMTRLIAIDPGSKSLGIAVFDHKSRKLIEAYSLKSSYEAYSNRIKQLCRALKLQIIKLDQTEVVVCEDPLLRGYANNVMQRLIGALEASLEPVFNFIHPMTVKKALGSGTLDKDKVAKKALKLLKTDEEKALLNAAITRKDYDATDAVAIGLTYLIQKGELDAPKAWKKQKND